MLRALEWAAEHSDDNEAEFFTDSALLYNTMTSWINGWACNGWKRKSGAIKNLDLVQALYPYRDRKFNHLRGHAGDQWNEWCDRAAVDARLCLEASEC